MRKYLFIAELSEKGVGYFFAQPVVSRFVSQLIGKMTCCDVYSRRVPCETV